MKSRSLNGTPFQSDGVSLAIMGSHSVTCHPTQVNTHRPQPDRLVLDLPTPKGWKAELT